MAKTNSELVLTYAELGEKLSIKPASAKRLAQRRKWPRVIGNDGSARVRVPVEAVPDDVPSDVIDDVQAVVIPDLSSRVAHLEGVLEGMRGELEAERKRADAAEARINDIAEDRDAWRQQAQRSLWSKLFGGS